MLRSIRRARLCVQLQTHNPRTRWMHLQIELYQLEQCCRILQRQRRTNGALMLCTAVEKEYEAECGDGPRFPANAVQQRSRHARKQEEQTFKFFYREVQVHALYQTGLEARL